MMDFSLEAFAAVCDTAFFMYNVSFIKRLLLPVKILFLVGIINICLQLTLYK